MIPITQISVGICLTDVDYKQDCEQKFIIPTSKNYKITKSLKL